MQKLKVILPLFIPFHDHPWWIAGGMGGYIPMCGYIYMYIYICIPKGC